MPAHCSSRASFAPTFVLLLALPATAQWTMQSPSSPPTPRRDHTMVYAPGLGSTLLFGGSDGQFRNDTWSWNGIDWQALAPAASPPPRSRHAMAFDSARNRFVLFGGIGNATALCDTWEWDGSNWQQLSPAASPPARFGHAMAFDPAAGTVLLFGGGSAGTIFGDTWTWDGTNWSRLSPASAPSPRTDLAMVHDPVRGETLLFGGFDGVLPLGETWVFHDDWRRLTPANEPSRRSLVAMAFDSFRGKVVLFGGSASLFQASNETWEWDGLDWRRQSPPAMPSARFAAAMTFDENRSESVLFGGTTTQLDNQTWTYGSGGRASFTAFGAPCPATPALALLPAPGNTPTLGSIFQLDLQGALQTELPIGVIGFSRTTTSGGQPLPLPLPGGCLLRIDPLSALTLPATDPSPWPLAIPNSAALAGVRFHAQGFALTTAGLGRASNAAECRIAAETTGTAITESFINAARLDANASADVWGNGFATPGILGGDGRHGSFDPTLGTQVAANVYEWSTDNFVIPAERTLTGRVETIADGRFEFTDLVLPAGVTVRFTGGNPVVLRARGRIDIAGRIEANGAQMTVFQARDRFSSALVPGQPGGQGGPGGGRGGAGGDRCSGSGPTIVGGVNTNDGRRGEDVRLAAGHAYAGRVTGSGGAGSLLFPSSGLNSAIVYRITFGAFSGMIASGGGGGGFATPGAQGVVVSSPSPAPNSSEIGPPTPGGVGVSLFPLPAATSSLDHFLAGGSGGGGGGSHPFLAVVLAWPDTWKAGAGGSGGGGAVALRAGRRLHVAPGGVVEATGGAGFQFFDNNFGIPAPGGGGSGGSVLLQSAGDLVFDGQLDTSGGNGSSTGNITPPALNGVTTGGAGSPGLVRLELLGALQNNGTTVPALTPNDTAPLTDIDVRTGSRSTWIPVGAAGLPVFLRYELEADFNGLTVLFSDDPSVSAVSASSGSFPVRIRFQGARADTGGAVDPGTAGPWRDFVGTASGSPETLNRDRAQFVRFDLTFDKSLAPTPRVRSLRIFRR